MASIDVGSTFVPMMATVGPIYPPEWNQNIEIPILVIIMYSANKSMFANKIVAWKAWYYALLLDKWEYISVCPWLLTNPACD